VYLVGGIDRLRLIFYLLPVAEFKARLEGLLKTVTEFWQLCEIQLVGDRWRIRSEKGVKPFIFIELHIGIGQTIVELNPNDLPGGLNTLNAILRVIFGGPFPDPRITRIDLNADILLPVDYLFRILRVPYKRIVTKYSRVRDVQVVVSSNRGTTGFVVGVSPSLLRCYRKKPEGGGRSYARLEWELRRDRVPIRRLSEIHKLLQLRPFDCLIFKDCSDVYDWENDNRNSQKRYHYNHLVEDYGAQVAAKILNGSRNFTRTFGPVLMEVEGIHEQLHQSYLRGVKKFLGEPS